jgi:hypothetical protein
MSMKAMTGFRFSRSLKVLDYCLREGSEQVLTWANNNIKIIKALKEFQYINDDLDYGKFVRDTARDSIALAVKMRNKERLRNEGNLAKPPLPLGWESRLDTCERVYYVDHNTSSTSWKRPSA